MRNLRMLACLLLLALAAAACGDDTPATTESEPAGDTATTEDGTDPAAEETTEEAAGGDSADEPMTAGAATVAVAETSLGEVLVDGEGMTLYLFDNDSGGESNCYDQCATNWPPLLSDGEPAAGSGADAALLGTTERTDGTMQVTYNGHPLYYFAADSAAGDTKGQGVGGIWWAVTPAGEAVSDTAAAAY